MSKPPAIRSPVPLIRLRGAEALAVRIAGLKDEARRQGYEALAYFLHTAELEANLQAERETEASAMKDADPHEVWLPVPNETSR